MAALDGSWWMAWWWPWALWWVFALVALGLAGAVFVRARRRDRTPTGHLQDVVYTSLERMQDLYAQHQAHMEAEVKRTITRRRSARLESSVLATLTAELAAGRDEEVVETYLTQVRPALVVRTVLEVLEKANDVVRVDLVERRAVARPGRALERARADAPQPCHLSDLIGYVLLRGRFRRGDDCFTAAFGEGTIIVRCPSPKATSDRSQLLCLGQVGDWDPVGKRLTFSPLAIMRA